MNELVIIEGKEVARVYYREQPVLTFEMVDDLHERPVGTTKRSFSENRKWFKDGVNFVRAPYAEWVEFRGRNTYSESLNSYSKKVDKRGGSSGEIILLFLSDYLMVVKPMRDDRSWKIQQVLVESYFMLKELQESAKYVALLEDFYQIATKKFIERKSITPAESARMKELKAQGIIDTEIGRIMGRNRSSIHYELRGGKSNYKPKKPTE